MMDNPFLGTELPFVILGWIPALIAAGAMLYGAHRANQASARQASQQMDFQERMSTSAHQREVGDLRAAGLNPILSATGGRGASSPAGAQAPQRNIAEQATSSALAVKRQKVELGLLRQTTLNKKHEAMLLRENTGRAKWERRTAAHNAFIANNSRYQSDVDVRMRQANQPGDLDAAKFWSSTAYGIKRRADAALETGRKLIPFTTPGQRSPRKYKNYLKR